MYITIKQKLRSERIKYNYFLGIIRKIHNTVLVQFKFYFCVILDQPNTNLILVQSDTLLITTTYDEKRSLQN